MQIVEIQNLSRPLTSPIRAVYCNSFLCQFRGLMLRRNIGIDEGLLLVQKRENRAESAIHMLFMLMDLAVVWLDASYHVVDVKYAHRWRLAYTSQSPAKYVLELSTERLDEFKIGDQLYFDETYMA